MKPLCLLALVLGALFGAPGCDENDSSSPPQNTLPIVVNAGPPGVGYVNGLFTSITVCVPGAGNCQVIDSVLVDTGSSGLRILSSKAGGELKLTLPQENDSKDRPIVECSAFVDGFTWGPLRLADVTMGSEKVSSLAVQVIGDPGFDTIPDSCSGGMPSEDTIAILGTNAILGVGPSPQDCGGPCAESVTAVNTENPGNIYYACPPSGCVPVAVGVESQIQNPVSKLPIDNNGVLVELPTVPAGGAPSVVGTLVFGIGTQSNNDLGSAMVLPIDPESYTFTTSYRGKAYELSFIDSGSNAIYFLDHTLTGLPVCSSGFYCPKESSNFTATNVGINEVSSTVTFGVADSDTLINAASSFALDDLAAPSTPGGEYFDFGLPFFFGRNVFFAIQGSFAPGGATPYFAY